MKHPILDLLALPGVTFHKIVRQFACDILHVPIYYVCYFSMNKLHLRYITDPQPNKLSWHHDKYSSIIH